MTGSVRDEGAVAIISLGAGVQSTTLLLMANRGDLYPYQPVEAIFADTGWEPASVYRHLEWLRSVSEIPITTVSAGNVRAQALDGSKGRFASIPLHIRNADGSMSIGRRQCTREFKIDPIRKRVRQIHLANGRAPIVQMIGISTDEGHRAKHSGVKYITHRWPLIDAGMNRIACLLWLEKHGYPRPPKSACIGCPFHDDRQWGEMKRNDPEAWADAVDFDRRIRAEDAPIKRGLAGTVYLHRSGRPLDEVDLSSPQDNGQLDLFDLECEGMCGV